METPITSRFWSYVDKSAGPDACWLWTGGKRREYGRFHVSHRQAVGAHCFSYTLTHGAIPEGIFVCHHCDTPLCVNPAHLFLGTNRQNIRDAMRKKRLASGLRNGKYTHPEATPRGQRHGRALLTAAQVRNIRKRYPLGKVSYGALAQEYGVGKSTIFHIVKRDTWQHIV